MKNKEDWEFRKKVIMKHEFGKWPCQEFYSDNKNACLFYGRGLNNKNYCEIGISENLTYDELKKFMRDLSKLGIYQVFNIRDKYSNLPHNNGKLVFKD